MKGLVYGRNDLELERKLKGQNARELINRGLLIGLHSQIVDQLGALADVGVDQVMVQWQELEDLDLLAHFSQHVLEAI